jgi:hypothetical protein
VKLNEISGGEPLVVSMYKKIKASKDWGPYWVDADGIGHGIYSLLWVPAGQVDGRIIKEKIVVDLSTQNSPRPRVLRFSGGAIKSLRLKKMLVPGQFAVDHERWYLVKEPK